MAETFLARGVVEDLCRDNLYPVFFSGVRVLPDIDKVDLELFRIVGPQFFEDGCHHLAGDAGVCAKVNEAGECLAIR